MCICPDLRPCSVSVCLLCMCVCFLVCEETEQRIVYLYPIRSCTQPYCFTGKWMLRVFAINFREICLYLWGHGTQDSAVDNGPKKRPC